MKHSTGRELEKIRSEKLREKVEQIDSRSSTVVVELNPSSGERIKLKRGAHGEWRPSRIDRLSGEDPQAQAARAVREIEQITGRPPVNFFGSSHTVVVEATGQQLRRIAQLPEVAAIWPNDRV
jgi:hypothetical protein